MMPGKRLNEIGEMIRAVFERRSIQPSIYRLAVALNDCIAEIAELKATIARFESGARSAP